jgi:hypothetical protein
VNDFDQAARYAAKLDPAGFLGWLLPGLDPAWSFREWMDTRRLPFPGARDRTNDTLAALANSAAPAERWAVIVEFQSEPAGDMLARLLDYVGRLYVEMRPTGYRVAGVVVNLTGPPQPDTLTMVLPGMEEYGLRLRAVQRSLREEDAAGTLGGIGAGRLARCLLPWVPLMNGAADSAIIQQWKAVADTEPNAIRRSEYGGLAVLLADLAGRAPEWKRELEGWNVRQSQVANEWRAEILRDAVLRALELRCRTPAPPDLEATIQQMLDLDELRRWHEAAVLSESLDEFRRRVQANGHPEPPAESPPTNGR